MQWLQYVVCSNTVRDYLVFLAIIVAALLVRRYLSKALNFILFRLLRQHSGTSGLKDFNDTVLPPMQWLLVLMIFVVALESLSYPEAWKKELFNMPLQVILNRLMWAVVLFSFMKVILSMITYISMVMVRKAAATDSWADDQLVPFMKEAAKVVVFIVFIFLLLGAVFDLNITSLLAGLGIGGLAIAFAAQESIKDLFGSITVFLDKPFTVGDIIKAGEVEGTVERVGFRSTRVRTYDQTMVTLPNKKMLDTNVDNLTLRRYRRVRSIVRLAYDTPPDAMRDIITGLRTFFRDHAHFGEMESFVVLDEFAENSMNLLVIYFIPILIPDRHLALKEEANFKIVEMLSLHNASFATPVREIRIDAEMLPRREG